MKDLTQGSVGGHLVTMAIPMAAGMIFQTLYYFVDLYFVARLGDTAVAGVSAAGNAMFIVLALTQVLGVGAVALISHAVGRKDQADANLIFNQSLLIAVLCGVLTLVGGYALAEPYVALVGADAATIESGTSYLYWFLPGMALQFALVAMSSALRGTGIVKPTMIVQAATVLLNAVLAPILIAGWGTGYAMGVAGAGLASSVSVAAGVLLLWFYFARLERYVTFHGEQWQPRLVVWKRMMNIGLPSGGEFALIFLYTATTYWVIRNFGAAAQAGFGIGSRVMQGIFLPAMAIAFAVAPVAGQNFGAGRSERVRETFRSALKMGTVLMLILTLLCQWRPDVLIAFFSKEPEVIEVGALFLRLISWNFVTSVVVFTCSGMFQALGNTMPSLLSSGTRLITYAVPAVWLSTQPWLRIEHIWYLGIATTALQMLVSLLLLRNQLRDRLDGMPATAQA
ncbi:MAG: MATE family efflux transporter [Steroidobacter sp.]